MTTSAPARRDDTGPQVPRLPSDAGPRRTGQATAVEQHRAAAQVYAAVLVAHEARRVTSTAVADMTDACRQAELAERAFYSFRRGGETVAGPTVQLARELARCWGNIEHGLVELSRDDALGESEMLAFAWDLQSNTRSSHTFIVKHLRDTKTGTRKLTEQRDIYENNANNGARRVREAIFAVLPGWYVEQAVEQCQATVRDGGGVPLQRRITDAVDRYAAIRVTRAQLERHVGAPADDWTAHDVARLGVTYKSIERGETSVAEQFPREQDRVTTDEIRQQAGQTTPPAGSAAAEGGEAGATAPTGASPGPSQPDDGVDRSDEQRELEEQEAAGS